MLLYQYPEHVRHCEHVILTALPCVQVWTTSQAPNWVPVQTTFSCAAGLHRIKDGANVEAPTAVQMETACKVGAIAILVLWARFAIRQYADQMRTVPMERCQTYFCTCIFLSTAKIFNLMHGTLNKR